MAGEMDVDFPEQRGEKRPVEETDVSGPPNPKRIKVGVSGCQLYMRSSLSSLISKGSRSRRCQ